MKTTIVALLLLGMVALSSGACSLGTCIQGAGTTCAIYEAQKTCLTNEKAKCTSSDTIQQSLIDAQILAMNAAITALNQAGQKCGTVTISASVTLLFVGVLAAIFKK